jgi:hypothetical protein
MSYKRRFGRSTLEVALLIPLVLVVIGGIVDMSIYMFILNDTEISLDKLGDEIVAKINEMPAKERAINLLKHDWLVEEFESRFISRHGVQLIKPLDMTIVSNGISSLLTIRCQYQIVTPFRALAYTFVPETRVISKERTWVIQKMFQTMKTAKLFGTTLNEVKDFQALLRKLEWGYVTILRLLGR